MSNSNSRKYVYFPGFEHSDGFDSYFTFSNTPEGRRYLRKEGDNAGHRMYALLESPTPDPLIYPADSLYAQSPVPVSPLAQTDTLADVDSTSTFVQAPMPIYRVPKLPRMSSPIQHELINRSHAHQKRKSNSDHTDDTRIAKSPHQDPHD